MTDLLRPGKRAEEGQREVTEPEIQPEAEQEQLAEEEPTEKISSSPFLSAINVIREACSRGEIAPELWGKITSIAENVTAEVLGSPGKAMDFVLNGSPEVESYIHLHALNLSILSLLIWRELGGENAKLICAIGMIHDVGMFDLPWDLIHGGPISDPDSRRLIEEHPRHTLRRLEPVRGTIPDEMLMAAVQEHERMDGSGYPEGIEREEIHIPARVIQVADLFEALTHPRPYREGHMEPFEAMCHIVREVKEGKLDRNVVSAFIDSVSIYPVGSFVELSDGRAAKVVSANRGYPFRPKVMPQGGSETVDLSEKPDLYIRRQTSAPT
jgi:HD-GYP domain-containing protein (c-di-GMP phosphodiesterase class II)